MSENAYAVTWPGVDEDCARELAGELESLGLTFKPTQAGGLPGQEVVEVVVAWIQLKEVLVGAASGLMAASIERIAVAIHRVVKKRGNPDPGVRHKIHVFVNEGEEFRCTVDIDVDQVPSQETIKALMESAEKMHKNHLKAFRERNRNST